MAKVKPAPYIESMSGSVSNHTSTHFRTNKRTGKTYAVHRCQHNNRPPTPAQRRRCDIFAAQTRAAAEWMQHNRPNTEQPQGTPLYQRLRQAFEHQHQHGNILAFLRTHMDDDCNVNI